MKSNKNNEINYLFFNFITIHYLNCICTIWLRKCLHKNNDYFVQFSIVLYIIIYIILRDENKLRRYDVMLQVSFRLPTHLSSGVDSPPASCQAASSREADRLAQGPRNDSECPPTHGSASTRPARAALSLSLSLAEVAFLAHPHACTHTLNET